MEAQITDKELKVLSKEFRTIGSRLLNSNHAQGIDNLRRFVDFIERSTLILGFIEDCKQSYESKFTISDDGFEPRITRIPQSREGEISFTYALLHYLADPSTSPDSYGSYCHAFLHQYFGGVTGNNFQKYADDFAQMVILPFIQHINNHIQQLLIYMDTQDNRSLSINIGENKGQLNLAQDQAKISAVNYVVSEEANQLVDLVKEFLEYLRQDDLLPADEKEAIQDILEVSLEQVQSEKPKLGLLKTALSQVKRVPQLLATATTTADSAMKFITTSEGLASALEHFIHTLQHL